MMSLLLDGVQAVGWCLLHFLWQAALVGAVYAMVRGVLPRGNARYLAGMLALVALAACPVLTAWHEWNVAAQPLDLGTVQATGAAARAHGVPATATDWRSALQATLPWLVLAWACGVGFLTLRAWRQWRGLQTLVRAAQALPEWGLRARLFALRLGLRHAAGVLASARIATPTLVGWLKPVIVMPLAILERLPPEQIELILAHELAHLGRLDHLANLFQVMLETLFFYHPVVHWISRDVRNERELCCDALALRATGGERADFVAALAGLEEFRETHADLVLAANGGVLLERAWFIAGGAPQRPRIQAHVPGLLLALLGMAVMLGALWRQDALRHELEARLLTVSEASMLQRLAATTVRAPSLVIADLAPARLAEAHATLPTTPARTPAATLRPVHAAAPALRVSDLAPAALATPLEPASAARPAAREASAPVLSPAAEAAPQPVRVVQPVYPEDAMVNGVQGQVVVEFSLDANGTPENLEVVGASPTGVFDEAARRALAQWRFRPPSATARRYRQTFSFSLGGAASGAQQGVEARSGCYRQTGTHICHPLGELAPVLTVHHLTTH